MFIWWPWGQSQQFSMDVPFVSLYWTLSQIHRRQIVFVSKKSTEFKIQFQFILEFLAYYMDRNFIFYCKEYGCLKQTRKQKLKSKTLQGKEGYMCIIGLPAHGVPMRMWSLLCFRQLGEKTQMNLDDSVKPMISEKLKRHIALNQDKFVFISHSSQIPLW